MIRFFIITAAVLVSLSAGAASYNVVMDQSVVQEISAQFAAYKSLSLNQYMKLKSARDPQLFEAQRSLYQFLQSTSITTMPAPTDGLGKDGVAQILDKRSQVFDNPTIVQTGFEILARELSKGVAGAQCGTIRNTIRFISTGVNAWGKKTPGLDYRGNMLLTMHLFAAYVDRQQPAMLPCQDEMKDFAKVYPELRSKTAADCYDCTVGKFYDRDTAISLQVLAVAFMSRSPFGHMVIAGEDPSFFKSYVQSLMTNVYLSRPEDKAARQAEQFGYDCLVRWNKPYDSWAVVIGDHNEVIADSRKVLELYSKLAAE